MLTPVFSHGTYENTIKAIQEGKIKYPAYCWLTDIQEYGFLNKNNELETIGIPSYTGTLENKIILSDFSDGIYHVKGQYMVTNDSVTIFSTESFITVIVQTINNEQHIKHITSDEISDYVVVNGSEVSKATYITTDYMEEKGYTTTSDVEDIINESIVDYPDDDIRELFNRGGISPLLL